MCMVTIVRQPLKYIKTGDINISEIEDIHWEYESGGVHAHTADAYIYGYIDYSKAAELVDCSGSHKKYNNGAKVCILKGLNIRNGHQKGYEKCFNRAGKRPPSNISQTRPEGKPPCTKRILEVLNQETACISRKDLREKIRADGYSDITFRSAMNTLIKQRRAAAQGDSRSPGQKISLPVCNHPNND